MLQASCCFKQQLHKYSKGVFTPDANKSRYSREVGRLNILSLLTSFAWVIRGFTTKQTRIRVMGGASARQLQSRCKMYSCFCKSTKMYIQLRVPTYNHNYFVLHCCFGFSASVMTSLLEQAPDWLTRREYPPKFRFFNSRDSQDCLSRLCIDLTCTSFASGVNAP